MTSPKNGYMCPTCGHDRQGGACSLCDAGWNCWELMFAPIPIEDLRKQVAVWIGQLPQPVVLEIAALSTGVRLRIYAPTTLPIQPVLDSFAAMTSHQMRWRAVESRAVQSPGLGLRSDAQVPVLALSDLDTDPLLAIGSRLQSLRAGEGEAALRIWLLGRDPALQDRLKALSAYSYGTEGGVENDTPNPWGIRLAMFRGLLFFGMIVAGVSAGAWTAGWISVFAGLLGVLSGGVAAVTAMLGIVDWMRWRSIPKDILTSRIQEPLLKVAFTLSGATSMELLAGVGQWQHIEQPWPAVKAIALSLPVSDIAALVSPMQKGEGSGVLDRAVRQDVPTPPPSLSLTNAAFKIGWSAGTGEMLGVDPDGHGLATGGSRTGKSSFAYAMLKRLIEKGDDAPGIFLVDPHASLADGFLDAIAQLPDKERAMAVKRLRIITPDQPEVVPLNLLCIPDFTWAGNAIVQIGNRIWDDYWGPRMQAALLGLFKLAHAWNQVNPTKRMGLLHVVFAAYNPTWRKEAMAELEPAERVGTIALDALLGQVGGNGGNWAQGWITEVVSPILSKVMALELSPWLFAAMHQNRFADMEYWVRERAWVVMRLPSGTMGREGSRLTAGVVYNVFDAAFRKVTMTSPIPFYFIVDEAQEIGAGMRLESMLAEGAKFGARMFVLVQSLSMMRQAPGMEPVVQALLANTSTQAFFSPDPEDADLIRATLSSTVRYGATTLDLPSLHCWLRARLAGQWQPPTLVRVEPLARAENRRVQMLIRQVIEAHPADYVLAEDWQKRGVRALSDMLPPSSRALLDAALKEKSIKTSQLGVEREQAYDENHRRLGFNGGK
ncbi:MAG: type IV secretory system conjugative DNA transfer family protein [Chloroflexota bacterium]